MERRQGVNAGGGNRGGGFGKFLLVLIIVAAGGFLFGAYHFNESPTQFWQRLVRSFEEFAKPSTATPSPTPVATPTPSPTPTPPPAPSPELTPSPTPEATPTPDPVAWIQGHREYWPKTLTLEEPANFPITLNGSVAGSAKVASGAKVTLDRIEPGFVTVTYGGGSQRLPIDSTDLRQQAQAAMASAAMHPEQAPSESAAPSVAGQAVNQAGRSTSVEQATPVLDEIAFGDASSEQTHELQPANSEVIRGGLEQPARRLLPGGEYPWEGGPLKWTMKVDPKAQNYVTVKLWGSDKGEDSGRLLLFANGLQVGYRHEGDYDVLSQCDKEPLAPGRFVYVTLPLPPKLTEGKTCVDMEILPIGPMWPYGPTWEKYQKPLTQPTRGIYSAYTHTAPRFNPAVSEKQGEMPTAKTRTSPGEEVIAKTKKIVIDRLTGLLHSTKAPGNPGGCLTELSLLAEAYHTSWTPTYKNPRVLDLIARDGDALAEAFAADPKFIEAGWPGVGSLGKAIMLTWPALSPKLDAKTKIGSNEMTRRQAWAPMLRASIDYWRTHRRAYTNQSMIVDIGIYSANRGLALIDPSRALPEAKVLRYFYEDVGLEPWLGSDNPGGGSEKPYGSHYYQITRKGLSRELGYVGTYGETILTFMREMVDLTGDQKIRGQLRKIEDARMNFRYPGLDGDGYRCMKLVSEVDNRTAHYPLAGSAYNAPGIRESWWMEVPAMLPDDPMAVGAAQQSIEEGQYFSYVGSRLKDQDTLGMMRNVDEWEKVSKLPKSAWRLPMTPGQSDFAFADEENAVLALKHGEDRLFINFYYRSERGVNRAARIFELTPSITRLATVRPEVEVISSDRTYTRPDWIDWTRTRGLVPPGEDIHQAWAGDTMPISKRPDDAKSPAYDDWGPFLGKAAFYSLQYGNYLIGLNTTSDRSYALKVPPGIRSARDLISGKEMDLSSGSINVPPLSTVIFALGGDEDTITH